MPTKKRTKTSVSRSLDVAERNICMFLAGYKCENPYCDQTESLQWCHIVKRGRKALRWDRFNSIVLCKDEHWVFDNMMTDRQRYKFVQKLRPDISVYDHLDTQIKLKFELTLEQMLLLLEEKRNELKELKNG